MGMSPYIREAVIAIGIGLLIGLLISAATIYLWR